MKIIEAKAAMFPLAVLDFEASSLDRSSFPIEVGVAIAQDGSGQIEQWSTLIRPEPAWDVSTAWDPDAERVHGIARRDLVRGLPPAGTLRQLNALLGDIGVIWCGDGKYDPFWMGRLCSAASTEAAFQLHGIGAASIFGKPTRQRLNAILANTAPPHRAGPDASRLCQALREAIAHCAPFAAFNPAITPEMF